MPLISAAGLSLNSAGTTALTNLHSQETWPLLGKVGEWSGGGGGGGLGNVFPVLIIFILIAIEKHRL